MSPGVRRCVQHQAPGPWRAEIRENDPPALEQTYDPGCVPTARNPSDQVAWSDQIIHLHKETMQMRIPIRHGEILLLPVASVADGIVEQVTECIVGHSESGHHHVLESDTAFTKVIASNGDLYVDLAAPAPLRHRKTHQNHRELTVPAGAWQVIRKTEFDARAMPEPPDDAEPLPSPSRRWVLD